MSNRVARYTKYAKRYPAFKKRYNVYVPAVKQLASDVMYLKGLINSEPQSLTTQQTNNVSWSGTVISMSNMTQGTAFGDRQGDRVLPRYFSLNMSVATTSAFSSHKLTCRVITFRYWGENANGGAPTVTPSDILQTTGSVYAPLSHLNVDIIGPRNDRTRRVEVLRSDIYDLDDVGHASQIVSYNIEMNGKNSSKKEHIEYANAGTGDPISGGVYVLVITDNTLSGQFQYQLEGKLTFYDN